MLSVWQKTGYRYSIDAPTRVSAPICAKKGEKWSSQCQPRLFYIHPRQLPCAQHVMIMPAHLPPTNAPTDNMRTKSHDAKKCHQWLRGRVIIVEPHGVGIELRTFVSTFYKWSFRCYSKTICTTMHFEHRWTYLVQKELVVEFHVLAYEALSLWGYHPLPALKKGS